MDRLGEDLGAQRQGADRFEHCCCADWRCGLDDRMVCMDMALFFSSPLCSGVVVLLRRSQCE